MGSSASCRNCAEPLSGPYCARCGQRDLPLREPFWRVLGRFAGEQLVLDSRMGRTVGPFLFRPGFLTREHSAGRRARYSDPLRLYVLMSLILFLAISVRGTIETLAGADVAEGRPTGSVELDPDTGELLARWFGEDSMVARAWERQLARFEALPEERQAELFYDTALAKIPTAMLLLLPVFALVLRLVYVSSGWLYAQHFVFVLHVHAFYYLAFLVPVLIRHWASAAFVGLLIPTYFVAALRGAYGERGLAPWLRALVMLPLYVATLAVVVLVVLMFSVLTA